MENEIKANYGLVKILLILLIVAVGSYLLSIGGQIIGKFLGLVLLVFISWLVSIVLEPAVLFFQRSLKTSLVISTVITYLILILALGIVGYVYLPLLSTQIMVLVNIIPGLVASLPPALSNWSTTVSSLLNSSLLFIPSVFQFLFSAVMVLTFSFYFIIDRETISREIYNVMPVKWHENSKYIVKVVNDVFVSFLQVQLFYGVTAGLLTWLILALFGIDLAVSIGFLAGVLTVIPLIGAFLAIVLPVLVALLVSPIAALVIGVFLVIVQQVIFNVIGPKIMGKAFKLHPAVILFSFLVGLQLAGGIGALFAIPILGICVVIVRRFGAYFAEVKNEATRSISGSLKRKR